MAKYDMEACHFSHAKEIQGYPITRQGYGDGLLGQSRSYNDKLSLKGSTVTGTYYANELRELREALKSKWRGKLRRGVLLLRDNAPAHTAGIVTSVAAQCGYPCWNST